MSTVYYVLAVFTIVAATLRLRFRCGRIEVQFFNAWYDFWVGWFWHERLRRLYVFPVPCFGFYVQLKKKTS
jgi:hypothetical protein